MAQVDSETGTVFANVDWDHYLQSRPRYPPSLQKVIYDYHQDEVEDVGWGRLVDIGSGVGNAASLFAKDFDEVYLVDPSPRNVANAQAFITQWRQRHGFPTTFEYTQCKAEDVSQHIKPRTANMVICAEAAHFIDPDKLVHEAAKILRPGGTLAIYSYWLPYFPQQSRALSVALNKAFTRILELCLPPGDVASAQVFASAAARVTAGNGVLSSIAVPVQLYSKVRRVRINPTAEVMLSIFKDNFFVKFDPYPVRIDESEQEKRWTTGTDSQAEGWAFETDNKWLRDFLDTFRPDGMQFSEEQLESIYGEWHRAFADECPSGKVFAVFPVNLLLATRKEG